MKKLGLLIALMLLTTVSYAASVTATFGDANSNAQYRVKSDTDGTITFASDTSISYPYSDVTSATVAQALAATDSGKIIIDEGNGSLSGHKFTLPRAAPGLEFTIVVGAQNISPSGLIYTTVDTVDTSDKIDFSISSVALSLGDSIKSTGQTGDSVTLCSAKANHWGVCSMKGSWTDNDTN
jgi:hypothetical protein